MRRSLIVFALVASAPAFAADATAPASKPATPPASAPKPASTTATTATAPSAIAGGKVTSYDATKHSIVVSANGKTYTLSTTNAVIKGTIAAGATVDVTYANNAASAITVH